jgi:twinfilin-like protein
MSSPQNDLTPSSLHAHLNHLASPPPLSASEAALAEVREAEAAEAKRAALDPETEARRRAVVTGLGGKMAWGDGVADAMTKVAERSDDGWVVCLVSLD